MPKCRHNTGVFKEEEEDTPGLPKALPSHGGRTKWWRGEVCRAPAVGRLYRRLLVLGRRQLAKMASSPVVEISEGDLDGDNKVGQSV